MGIAVEFNPDLALRSYENYKSGKRKKKNGNHKCYQRRNKS